MGEGTCSIEACDKPSFCRSWCSMHYSRWQRNGDPSTRSAPKAAPLPCAADGCREVVRAQGWCAGHYMRWWRTGDVDEATPLPGAPLATLEARFWVKVEKTATCWLWTAASTQGRGIFRVGHERRTRLAHRVAYEMIAGPIPEGMELDHLCRVPLCVNPDHLEPVTHEENMRRTKRDSCPRGHSYEEHGRLRKDGSRRCSACDSERGKRRWAAVSKGERILREAVYDCSRGICGICREPVPFERFSIDHIVPLSRGGAHSMVNLQLAHLSCNARKGAS